MIVHLILYRPRPNLTLADSDAFVAAVKRAHLEIPSVRRFQIGRRVLHGVSYERLMTQDFPFAAVVEFDDVEGLTTYLQHPAHQEMGQRFWESCEAALVYDYELRDADNPALLIQCNFRP